MKAVLTGFTLAGVAVMFFLLGMAVRSTAGEFISAAIVVAGLVIAALAGRAVYSLLGGDE